MQCLKNAKGNSVSGLDVVYTNICYGFTNVTMFTNITKMFARFL